MEMELETMLDLIVSKAGNFALPPRPDHRPWTDAETAYLHKYAGVLPDPVIAAHLDRTVNAIRVRRIRAQLPSRHAHPDFVAASVVAKMLGLDEHKVCSWIDSGLLPGEIYEKHNSTGRCASGKYMRRVRLITLKRFITRPHNWIYFDPARIADPALKSLVTRAVQRWGDEWWMVRQVADYHHVDPRWIGQKLHKGEIPGLQAHNLGGRHPDAAWSYWFIRKSDALRARFIHSKGSAQRTRAEELTWSPRADAWILRARANGLTLEDIAARMNSKRRWVHRRPSKWTSKRVSYRYKKLLSSSCSPIPFA
jgi:hypothetical protein